MQETDDDYFTNLAMDVLSDDEMEKLVSELASELASATRARQIIKLIERPEIYPVGSYKNVVPQVGECILLNDECQSFTREHGGRCHRIQYRNNERYFGEVVEIYPHIIVLKTSRGLVSERIMDFKVGLLKYVKLKKVPESPEKISYDERRIETFVKSFEALLDDK